MKPINLYDIYRKVSTRARSPKSQQTQLRAEDMRLAAERILDKPSIRSVSEFRKLEQLWIQSHDISASMKAIAYQFEDAIRSKSFVVVRSHFDPRGINGNHLSGLVYCARSASMPGQLKIGFTTMRLQTRLQKMTKRHGVEQVRPLFAVDVKRPAEIEAHAKKKLRDCLVAGCTSGGSNEWYRASVIQIARVVVETIEEHGNSVYSATLFAGCPNPSNVKAAISRLDVELNRES